MTTMLRLMTVPGMASSQKALELYKESAQQMNRSLMAQRRSAAKMSKGLSNSK